MIHFPLFSPGKLNYYYVYFSKNLFIDNKQICNKRNLYARTCSF